MSYFSVFLWLCKKWFFSEATLSPFSLYCKMWFPPLHVLTTRCCHWPNCARPRLCRAWRGEQNAPRCWGRCRYLMAWCPGICQRQLKLKKIFSLICFWWMHFCNHSPDSPQLEVPKALSVEDALVSRLVRPVGRVTQVFADGSLLLELIRPPNGPFGFVISRGKGRPDTGNKPSHDYYNFLLLLLNIIQKLYVFYLKTNVFLFLPQVCMWRRWLTAVLRAPTRACLASVMKFCRWTENQWLASAWTRWHGSWPGKASLLSASCQPDACSAERAGSVGQSGSWVFIFIWVFIAHLDIFKAFVKDVIIESFIIYLNCNLALCVILWMNVFLYWSE